MNNKIISLGNNSTQDIKLEKIAFKEQMGSKLLKYVFGLYFFITLSVTAFQMYSEFNHVKDRTFTELANLQEIFSKNFAQAVWSYDDIGIKEFIEGLLNSESISGVKLLNDEGDLFVEVGLVNSIQENSVRIKTPEMAKKVIIKKDKREQGIFSISKDLKTNSLFKNLYEYQFNLWVFATNPKEIDRFVGQAVIYSSEKKIVSRVKHGFILIIINSALKTMALWIIFLIFVNKMLSRPLNAFTKSVQSIDSRNPQEDYTIIEISQRKDELGLLGKAFRKEMAVISNNIAEINDLNINLEKKVEERTAQLDEKTRDVRTILHTLKQGIFTLSPNLTINEEYSPFLEIIFNTNEIKNKRIESILFHETTLGENEQNQVTEVLKGLIGFDSFNFEMNSHLLPSEILYSRENDQKQIIEVDWDVVVNDSDIITKVLVSVRDVTQLRSLQLKAEEHKSEVMMMDELITVGVEKAKDFLLHSFEIINENRKLITKLNTAESVEVINILFRNMHTLKGNARTYKFSYAVDAIHIAEQYYDDIKKNKTQINIEKLNLELDTVEEKLNRYNKIISIKLSKLFNIKSQVDSNWNEIDEAIFSKKNLNDTAQSLELLKEIINNRKKYSYSSLDVILEDEIKAVTDMAKNLGKSAPLIEWDLQNVIFPNKQKQFIKDFMNHLLRNSIDHGIEKDEERVKKGKNIQSKISISTQITDNDLVKIIVKDDGGGLNLDYLKSKGLENKIISSDDSDEKVAEIIFSSGVSTATQVSDISGRGVGMDAVRSSLRAQGGDIFINFIDKSINGFRPFEFIIKYKI